MIRGFCARDAAALAELQRSSIAKLGPRAYSSAQIAAWLARAKPASHFISCAAKGDAILLADSGDGRIGGYGVLEPDGHLDHLYVHPRSAGRGLAAALLAAFETQALAWCLDAIYSEVSEVARPAFERAGWQVGHRRDLRLDGVAIHNYAMRRALR